jgi:hypothetical protein
LITDNSIINSKNNRLENTFTPITKDKKRQSFKFFNSIKKNKETPQSALKVNVIENTSLTQCKSYFSKTSRVKKTEAKKSSQKQFAYKYNMTQIVLTT